MSSPFHTLGICLSYVYIVKVKIFYIIDSISGFIKKYLINFNLNPPSQVLGPKLMENRKPFQLKNTLIAYNLFQVIFSTWLFYEVCYKVSYFAIEEKAFAANN
jgi:elongation of very long chain fatty acids protein 7